MTGVLVLAALPRARGRAFAVGLLAGSVLVDLDHIPKLLGIDWISQGTPRPYGRSLLTLVILAVLICTWQARRPLLFGALAGVAVHFGRDLGDQASGMPLFWPFSDSAYNVPHWIYLAAMGVVGAIALIRTRQGRYATRSPTSTEEPAPTALAMQPERRLGELDLVPAVCSDRNGRPGTLHGSRDWLSSGAEAEATLIGE